MDIGSLPFLLSVALVAVALPLLPGKRARQSALSVLNVGFLATFVPNPPNWAAFALVVAGSFGFLKFSKARPSGVTVFVAVTIAVAGLLVLRKYSLVQWVVPAWLWDHPIRLVGVAYILLKFIHVVVDQYQGQLAPLDFATYANYQLSFFTLVAGPIQRYNDFRRYWHALDRTPQDTRQVLLAWNRVLNGMIKMAAIAPLASYVAEIAGRNWGAQEAGRLIARFVVFMYAYPVFLYFNFSGYTDIMIGCSRLLGFDLPENFARPYLARNVIDFWNRWHISLTRWVRDYLFMASYKTAAEANPPRARMYGYGLLLVSLLLAGCWHGPGANFAVFGALHGIGAAVSQAYGDALKVLLGRPGFPRYQNSRVIRCIAVVTTFQFVCFTFFFLSTDLRTALSILGAIGRSLLPSSVC